MRVCEIPDCDRSRKRRDYCDMHWYRMNRYGVPDRPTPGDRFWRFVDKTDAGGCWLWTGNRSREGYGRLSVNNSPVYAHRFAYELLVGPIVTEALDHLCRVRNCVNPDHLEPVTHRENILRGTALSAQRARQTHCIRGHEFTPENTRIRSNGSRHCRECERLTQRLRRASA